jgi:hypothetical protein
MLNGEFASDVAAKNRIFLVTTIHRFAAPAPFASSQPRFSASALPQSPRRTRLAPWLHQAHEASRILKRLEYRTGA